MSVPDGFIWLVLTVYLESQNQPDLGQRNVAKVILNRAEKKKWPLKDITLAKKQFSCWNDGIRTPKTSITELIVFARVFGNCVLALAEWEKGDNIKGATHYYAPKSMIPKYSVPYWVKDMKFIGTTNDHKFYLEE